MLPWLKAKEDEEEDKVAVLQAAHPHVNSRDFIPYYCHYNAHTLLTKNGELLQTIRITSNHKGLEYEHEEGSAAVRECIRRAITSSVHSNKFSFWLHTVRKRRPVHYHPQFNEPFAEYAHSQWHQTHPWKHHFYNELYITILHDGQSAPLVDKNNLRQVLLPASNRRYRNDYLDQCYAALDQLSLEILDQVRAHYNARRLSVVERLSGETSEAVFYSEPMEFLGTILNLRTQAFPVSEADISADLSTTSLIFGFNALETKASGNRGRFAALLTLKRYSETPTEAADNILQTPVEFIISQSFSFISATNALKPYRSQKQMFDISGDIDSIKATGIEEMLRSNNRGNADFCNQQTNIMVIVDEYKQLENEVAVLHAAFAQLGLILIREDIRQEECFWAQFPGNFEFLRRKTPLNTARVGGFLRLNRFSGGQAIDNHWGNAVSLVPSLVNTPYFFNFHYRDNGHTVLFDFNSFSDNLSNITLNFLLNESRQYGGKLYVFDRAQSSRLLINKLTGDYHRFSALQSHSEKGSIALNPFTLEGTPQNQSFLVAWCTSLIGKDITPSQKSALQTAVGNLYQAPEPQRNLPELVNMVAGIDPSLKGSFDAWLPGGKFSGVFDSTNENLDMSCIVQGFDMSHVVKNPETIIPVFSYLLHRIISALDGTPTIIVLHEAWDLLENSFFTPRLESLMEMLEQNNAVLIFTTKSPADKVQTYSFQTILSGCATRIYFPDETNRKYPAESLGLDAHDIRLLTRMDRQAGDVLIKQPHESAGVRIDLSNMGDLYAIYANDRKSLTVASLQYTGMSKAG